jgi:hypothetical protein
MNETMKRMRLPMSNTFLSTFHFSSNVDPAKNKPVNKIKMMMTG